MDFSEHVGLAVACRGCGLPIEGKDRDTAVMVRVWVEQAGQYRAEGPFHADCGKRRDMQAQAGSAQNERAGDAGQAPRRCEHCDDTGDVTSIDGEWRGYCTCDAGKALKSGATNRA